MIFYTTESDIIINAIVIKMADIVPAPLLMPSLNNFEMGNG